MLVKLIERVKAPFACNTSVRLQWLVFLLQWLALDKILFEISLCDCLFPALGSLLFRGTFTDIFWLEVSCSTLLSLLPVMALVNILSVEILQPHASTSSASPLVASTLRVLGTFISHCWGRLARLSRLADLVLLHDVSLETIFSLEALLASIANVRNELLILVIAVLWRPSVVISLLGTLLLILL